MINKLRFGAAGAVIAAMAMASAANAAETETATAEADIVLAFTLTKDTDLDFGAIVNAAGGGSVVVSTGGVATCGGSLVCHGSTSAADFSIAGGSLGKNLYIELPDTSVTPLKMLHSTHGGTADATLEIELDTFTTTSDGSDATGDFVTVADDGTGVGEASFSVGGTATLDGSEVEGTYTTTFSVSVDYE